MMKDCIIMKIFNLLPTLTESSKSFHVGEHVGWNSEAGHVSGHIVKVHTKPFTVNGYTHHASSNAPQYEIVSDKSDHHAFHKSSALHHM